MRSGLGYLLDSGSNRVPGGVAHPLVSMGRAQHRPKTSECPVSSAVAGLGLLPDKGNDRAPVPGPIPKSGASPDEIAPTADGGGALPCPQTMRSDDARTMLIVADNPHLAAAVRERIGRETALIRWATPPGLAGAWRRCRPWPWVVIGSGGVPEELPLLVGTRPVVLAWLQEASPERRTEEKGAFHSADEAGPSARFPPGAGRPLPDGCRRLVGWPDLVAWLRRLAVARVGPLGLAPYRGVRLSCGNTLVRSPAVEALLAAHPRGLAACPSVRGVRDFLVRHSVPCTIRQHGNLLRLEPVVAS